MSKPLSLEGVHYALSYASSWSGARCALQAGDVAIVMLSREQEVDLREIESEYFGERNRDGEAVAEMLFNLGDIWVDYAVKSEAPVVYFMELYADMFLSAPRTPPPPAWLVQFVRRFNVATLQLSILEAS